jgi:SH3 domain-containing YSC84-like protein 1
MKLITTLLLVCFCSAAVAVERPELETRAQKLIAKFESLQSKPDKRVPPEVLRKAQGVILLDRTKAGFIFAYQGGGGLAMVKDKKGKWSPIAFMRADEASLGFQIGGQQTFLVIVLMNEQSTKTLIADAAFEFGGEARGTAGNASAGAEGKLEDIQRSVLVYDERQGLFGGAAIKGGSIHPDHDGNAVYYGGAVVTMQEILFDGKYKPTEPAKALAQKIQKYSKTP